MLSPTIISVWQVLFQKKGVVLGVLLFPALLTFVAGVGYDHNNVIPLTIGTFSESVTPLGTAVLHTLENKGYSIVRYKNLDLCMDRVRQGRIHSCVTLTKNLGQEQAIFYVNPSDLSLADYLRQVVHDATQGPTSEVARNSTQKLLTEVSSARDAASDIRPTIVDLTTNYQAIAEEVDDFVIALRTVTPSMNLTVLSENNSVSSGHDGLVDWMENIDTSTNEMIRAYDGTLDDIRALLDGIAISEQDKGTIIDKLYEGQQDLDSIRDELRSSDIVTRSKSSKLTKSIQDLTAQLAAVKSDIHEFNQMKKDAHYKAEKIKSHVDKTLLGVASVQRSLNIIGATVLDVTDNDPDKVLAPLSAKVGTVSDEGTPFDFVFPNVLILFVLISSICLSGMVHVHFNESPASIRRKSGPTSQKAHLVGQQIAVLLLVSAIGLIMSASALFFLPVAWETLPLLGLSVIGTSFVTVLIGSWIGHMLQSEEQAVLYSMGFSALAVLLSPMLRPIEQLPSYLKIIAEVNPLTCGLQIARSAIGGGTVHPAALATLAVASACLFIVLLMHKEERWNT
ncbi:MAG: ABC transporter permease [Candidatus Nanoarchaeia archaeon]